ncbi:MAG: caspase family protein [Thermoguttaceae bacterium]|nr:caspase family protein [Thermoguttaceae bacterium]
MTVFCRRFLTSSFLFAFLFLASNAFAQKVYVIAEGDFNANRVGQCVQAGVGLMRDALKSTLPKHRLVLYNGDASFWQGPDVSNSSSIRRDLLRAIARCPAGPNDAIVCYWCGHGAYDEGGHYFNLADDAIRRATVLAALKAKGCRFTALISESCHTYYEPTVPPHAEFTPAPDVVPPLLQSLFFESRGVLDINSSSPGQMAAASPIFGGPFTFALISVLTRESDRRLSWNQTIKRIDRLVPQIAQTFDIRTNQTVYAWSIPGGGLNALENRPNKWSSVASEETTFGSNVAENRPSEWSDALYHPENGDRIIAVNGNSIYDYADFQNAVANSDSEILLTLRDKRSGNKYYMRTTLLPKYSRTRLGVYVSDDGGEGVVVTGVMPNSPGNRCRYLKNGDVDEVSSRAW